MTGKSAMRGWTCLMLGLCFVLLNAAVDLACLLLDPRRRRGT